MPVIFVKIVAQHMKYISLELHHKYYKRINTQSGSGNAALPFAFSTLIRIHRYLHRSTSLANTRCHQILKINLSKTSTLRYTCLISVHPVSVRCCSCVSPSYLRGGKIRMFLHCNQVISDLSDNIISNSLMA